MKFLKVITKDGSMEYLNAQHILSVMPYGENLKYFKILMGAGLYWIVKADSVEIVELNGILGKNKIKGG